MSYRFLHRAGLNMHVPVTIIAAVFLVIGVVLAKGGAGSFETVTVKKGDSISYLCFKIYNEYHETIAAQIRRSNPGIADINIIYPGQKIKFPIFGPTLAERPTPAVIKGPPDAGKEVPAVTGEEGEPVQDRLQPQDAYLTYLDGKGRILRARTQKWNPMRINARLVQGDKVRIGKNSRAEIITFDADIIRLSENTELEINHLQNNPVRKTKKKNCF